MSTGTLTDWILLADDLTVTAEKLADLPQGLNYRFALLIIVSRLTSKPCWKAN
jgi:hypothetical protein